MGVGLRRHHRRVGSVKRLDGVGVGWSGLDDVILEYHARIPKSSCDIVVNNWGRL